MKIKNLIAENEVNVIGNKILVIARRKEEKFFIEEEKYMWTDKT